MDVLLSYRDLSGRVLAPVEEPIFLLFELVQCGLIVQDCLLVEFNKLGDIFANCIGQDKFASQTVTLIELSSESCQLTHNFNEIALCLSILILDLFLF